jgi:hypothetical protein
MVGGSVSKVGSVYSVSSRIIDVETGEISKMSSYDHIGDMGELLTKGMRFVAIELTKERKSQSLIPQGSGVGISDIKSSPSGESIEIDEIPIDEIKPATQKNITEEKPQVIVKRESDISLNKGGGDDYQKYISDKTWSIGGGISTSRSFNVMQISKDYKIGTNFSLFIFAGFPWVGIGLSLQSNYNDNGLILGSSIGQNLLWDKIDDSMDIMTSSFLNNYLGYQWRTGKENYITFGGVICTSISPKEEQSDVIGDSRWWEFWVPIISFDRRF